MVRAVPTAVALVNADRRDRNGGVDVDDDVDDVSFSSLLVFRLLRLLKGPVEKSRRP